MMPTALWLQSCNTHCSSVWFEYCHVSPQICKAFSITEDCNCIVVKMGAQAWELLQRHSWDVVKPQQSRRSTVQAERDRGGLYRHSSVTLPIPHTQTFFLTSLFFLFLFHILIYLIHNIHPIPSPFLLVQSNHYSSQKIGILISQELSEIRFCQNDQIF